MDQFQWCLLSVWLAPCILCRSRLPIYWLFPNTPIQHPYPYHLTWCVVTIDYNLTLVFNSDPLLIPFFLSLSQWTCALYSINIGIKETIWLKRYFKSKSTNGLEISDKVFPEYSPDREAWPYLAQCFREATALLCNREVCTSIYGSCC